jgi:hypothetical protein
VIPEDLTAELDDPELELRIERAIAMVEGHAVARPP